MKKVLLKHSNGTLRTGVIVGQHGNTVRVRWDDKPGEGVDIDLATESSPLGAWRLVG